jgi:hypothetical protein
MGCDALAPTSGSGTAYLGVSVSSLYGSDAYLDVVADDGSPVLIRDYDQPVAASVAGGALSATIPMIDFATGDPAPAATVTASLTPSGEPFAGEDEFRDGNVWYRSTYAVQPLAVDGVLSVGGQTFPLVACFGEDVTVTTFGTNPNARVGRFSDRSVGCELTNAAGDEAFIFIGSDGGAGTFVDAQLYAADGTQYYAFGELALSGGAGSADLDTYDPITDSFVGPTHVDVSLTAGDAFDYLLRNSVRRTMVRGSTLDVEGALTFPGGHAFDLGPCIGEDAVVKSIATNPQGPKPGGKAPANDVASGSKAAKVGGSIVQQTKSASPDAETIFPCLSFEDPESGDVFTIPVGHTVWFKVTGTGSEITIDTAGSDFDTVVAVYTDPASAASAVACNDDVALEPVGRTLQSAVTFPTVAGTTYYVQVGGYPDAMPYGILKLAVR